MNRVNLVTREVGFTTAGVTYVRSKPPILTSIYLFFVCGFVVGVVARSSIVREGGAVAFLWFEVQRFASDMSRIDVACGGEW